MKVYPQTNDRKSIRFHRDCYTLWNEERRAAFTLPFSAPPTPARCVACHGVGSHPVPVAECSIPVV